jgi:hypothetical protein
VKRLALLLLLLGPSAFAADGEVTVLRGKAAQPLPWYEPPPPPPAPPQPVVIYQPMAYPSYFYYGRPVVGPVQQHRVPDGWPLFRK